MGRCAAGGRRSGRCGPRAEIARDRQRQERAESSEQDESANLGLASIVLLVVLLRVKRTTSAA